MFVFIFLYILYIYKKIYSMIPYLLERTKTYNHKILFYLNDVNLFWELVTIANRTW